MPELFRPGDRVRLTGSLAGKIGTVIEAYGFHPSDVAVFWDGHGAPDAYPGEKLIRVPRSIRAEGNTGPNTGEFRGLRSDEIASVNRGWAVQQEFATRQATSSSPAPSTPPLVEAEMLDRVVKLFTCGLISRSEARLVLGYDPEPPIVLTNIRAAGEGG